MVRHVSFFLMWYPVLANRFDSTVRKFGCNNNMIKFYCQFFLERYSRFERLSQGRAFVWAFLDVHETYLFSCNLRRYLFSSYYIVSDIKQLSFSLGGGGGGARCNKSYYLMLDFFRFNPAVYHRKSCRPSRIETTGCLTHFSNRP